MKEKKLLLDQLSHTYRSISDTSSVLTENRTLLIALEAQVIETKLIILEEIKKLLNESN